MARHVLYVDDEPALCKAFERALRGTELKVVTTTSAKDAVGMLATGDFDVVASDYRMPVIDGLGVLRAARDHAPWATRLLVSGGTDADADETAQIEAVVDDLVPKPWSLDDLRRIVRRAAARGSLAREHEQLARAAALLPAKAGELLWRTLRLRDVDTGRHSRRVARLARALGERLGQGDVAMMELGALVHDVGKTGVCDRVLWKPGIFDDDDWKIMRRHPELGAELLSVFDCLESARTIVIQHHERWDGGGYPAGLAGEQICVGARIVAVVDTYDAMCSDRPHRQGAPSAQAREELSRCAGTQFDPTIVETFIEVPEEELALLRADHDGDG